ncbi:PDZ domain-containing protein [Ammonicoccus fulvus]|uniref:PDZ domain-containing protein n=1 Tax=Ammonicoccus fulvus TaxID=3138240 RepID=A0ABZ3FQA8_9ACTN
MTRQTRLSLAAAVGFVVLALLIAVLPVPYVIYSPGRAYTVAGLGPDQDPVIRLEGIPTYPVDGELHMTTVAVTRADAHTSLAAAVFAYWAPNRDALPRDSVYDPGKTTEQVRAEERQMMDTSQQDATVAGLRAADIPVEELPVVSAVTVSGPSHGRLAPGDLVLSINGQDVHTPDELRTRIQAQGIGEAVQLEVERDRQRVNVEVITVASTQDPELPVLGIQIGVGYRYEPTVTFGVSHDIGGPSAGVVFALAVFDLVTQEDLLRGRSVAGTGKIRPDGGVQAIGGLQEKMAGAEDAGATIFLVPGANCSDLEGSTTDMQIIRVDTLDDAINGLRHIDDPATAGQVPRC